MELNGRVVLVAGGTSGIGLAVGRAFAREGATVVVCGSREAGVKAVADSPEPAPGKLIARVCDVTDRVQVAGLFSWIEAEHGPVGILVNSAGLNVPQRMMADLDPADFDRVLAVNTTGVFNCIHAALPAMRARGEGFIVNINSLAGRRVLKLAGVPYCVSKFATAALGTFVGIEEARNGIRVTNVYPGETNTPLVDKRPEPPPAEKRVKMLQPEDVAECVIGLVKLPARAVVPELVITPPYMVLG